MGDERFRIARSQYATLVEECDELRETIRSKERAMESLALAFGDLVRTTRSKDMKKPD